MDSIESIGADRVIDLEPLAEASGTTVREVADRIYGLIGRGVLRGDIRLVVRWIQPEGYPDPFSAYVLHEEETPDDMIDRISAHRAALS